ncbi:type II secretion system F family protein [Geoglobus ahangari]
MTQWLSRNGETEFSEKFNVWVPKRLVKFYRARYEKRRDKYSWLERNLISSRLPVTVPKLLAIALFYPAILLPVFAFVSVAISRKIEYIYLMYSNKEIPPELKVIKDVPVEFSFQKPDVFVVEVLSFVILTLALLYLTRVAILRYPRLVVSQRRSKIESTLPHVVNIMLGMTKGGTPLLEIIKTVAEERTVTGEVGKEFSVIIREVMMFHRDIISAMRYVANTTPSPKLSEFLEDLISVVEGGGSLSDFLEFKSAHYIEERERYHEIFINSLEILAEVYVSLFVVAPLFTLIVFIVMGMMGEDIHTVSRVIVYGYIPLGGLLFIWLIRSMMRSEKAGWVSGKVIPVFLRARVVENGRENAFVYRTDFKSKLMTKVAAVRRRLNLPELLKNPEYTLIVTLPASIFVIAAMKPYRPETVLGMLFAVIAVPYVVLYEYRNRMIRKLEEELPEFLKQLGSLNESGLTLVAALRVLSTTNLGALTKEVMNIRKDVEWGRLITEALQRFDERVGSNVVSKVVSILVKALEATDNVKAAIFTAATDAEMYLEFRKRIANEMFVYTVIVYITFAVFLFTVVVLNQNFVKVFGSISVPESFVGTSFTFPDVEKLTTLFYHATLLNGFFSGLVAGVMGAGSIKSGLKHSLIMVLVSILVFHQFVGVSL